MYSVSCHLDRHESILDRLNFALTFLEEQNRLPLSHKLMMSTSTRFIKDAKAVDETQLRFHQGNDLADIGLQAINHCQSPLTKQILYQ